jgi:hypothetical protein
MLKINNLRNSKLPVSRVSWSVLGQFWPPWSAPWSVQFHPAIQVLEGDTGDLLDQADWTRVGWCQPNRHHDLADALPADADEASMVGCRWISPTATAVRAPSGRASTPARRAARSLSSMTPPRRTGRDPHKLHCRPRGSGSQSPRHWLRVRTHPQRRTHPHAIIHSELDAALFQRLQHFDNRR